MRCYGLAANTMAINRDVEWMTAGVMYIVQ